MRAQTKEIMKTNLNRSISTIDEAEDFLKELFDNGESFHPEDSAFHISWSTPKEHWPTTEECRQLDALMQQVISVDRVFDACEYLLELTAEEGERMQRARPADL